MMDTPQAIPYEDTEELDHVLRDLAHYPPLVFPGEIEELKSNLAKAEAGEAFILQGGDCVERFADCTASHITDRVKILLQMSVVLTYAARTPVIRIGRIAGQFFKPRSTDTETIAGEEVLSYRGDPVHDFAAKEGQPIGEARRPKPERLREGYFHAAATLNYVRSLIAGGFADLHHPTAWNLETMKETKQWEEYRHIVDRILDAIRFMESFGGVNQDRLNEARIYTSHEALHLPWERSFTRVDEESGRVYNTSAHTVWLGARTAHLDGPHVDYLAGIANPIGIKISPDMDPNDLPRLIDRLNPKGQAGKVLLITRLGHDRIRAALPPLIRTVQEHGSPGIWMVDPMHGNTETTGSGRKTRRFEAILEELSTSFRIHTEEGSQVRGVHFELTGDDVTECTGGAVPLDEVDLERRYESYCDPRLNYTQSMEMAFLMAYHYADNNSRSH